MTWSSSINWRALNDVPTRGPRPDNEWWYSLDPNENDDARTANIRRSIQRYEEKFGVPPAVKPRVIMVGKTPVLAYAVPVEAPIMPPQTIIVEEPTESMLQLTLL